MLALALSLALAFALAAPLPALAQKLPDYQAWAGMLNIGKDPERPDAEIFHVAYTLRGVDPAGRPVTFVFNGGPGGASIYLRLSAIGPKIIVTTGDGSFPAVPARLQDNPDSWIRFTDLVFIRQWLTVHQRWSSPKAIAGESYGGQRVAALLRILAETYVVNLNRAILISLALNVQLADTGYSLVAPMTLLPTQAAIAAHHGLSTIRNDPAAFKEVEDYAMNGFVIALARLGRAGPEERQAFYAKVGGLIGIDPVIVARQGGRVSESLFGASLLASRGQVIDTYDGPQASDNPRPQEQGLGVLDRSLTVLGGVLLAPFMDYVRKDLGYVSNRPYIPLNLEVNMAWDRNSRLGGPDDLGVALAQNTDLLALVVHGYHDMTTNYLLSRYVLEQATRAPGARRRLFFGTYAGGHMFYLRSKSRAELAADVHGFFEAGR